MLRIILNSLLALQFKICRCNNLHLVSVFLPILGCTFCSAGFLTVFHSSGLFHYNKPYAIIHGLIKHYDVNYKHSEQNLKPSCLIYSTLEGVLLVRRNRQVDYAEIALTYPETMSFDFRGHTGSAARVKTQRSASLLPLFTSDVSVIRLHVSSGKKEKLQLHDVSNEISGKELETMKQGKPRHPQQQQWTWQR